jgi:putative ABC transport system substrate-binding protein
MPLRAAELVKLNPNVFIAPATVQAVAIKKATTTIPIVVPALADAVELGLVASDAHPGGNLTGISPYVAGLPGKQLELAREIIPGATRIGLLDDPTDPKTPPQRREVETGGRELGINIIAAEARRPGDVGAAYAAFSAQRAQVVIVEQSVMLVGAREQIAEAAAAKSLPSVYGYREHVEAGGLISYGVNLSWCFHRAAYYVDRILKGQIELVINLNTAKALGLDVPATLLARVSSQGARRATPRQCACARRSELHLLNQAPLGGCLSDERALSPAPDITLRKVLQRCARTGHWQNCNNEQQSQNDGSVRGGK